VKNAFLSLELVREGLDVFALPANHDHLCAKMLIKMDVRSGKNRSGEVMLLLGQTLS
jgi:hypothetical protein